MTKYVLLGGYAWRAEDGGKTFAQELVSGFKEPVRFLQVMFARPEDEWEDSLESDKKFYASHLPGVQTEFAIARKDTFIGQIRDADVINLRGGATAMLREGLEACPGWEKALEGKTVAGSSAGANLLSRYFHGLDKLTTFEGFGLIPYKVIVHWKSDEIAAGLDWDEAYEQLKKHGEDLPILTLAEGEFKVLTQ